MVSLYGKAWLTQREKNLAAVSGISANLLRNKCLLNEAGGRLSKIPYTVYHDVLSLFL